MPVGVHPVIAKADSLRHWPEESREGRLCEALRFLVIMARQNVFIEIGFPKHEAALMLMRCDLAQKIRQWLTKRRLSRAAGAKRLGISAPRLNEIVKNRVEKVSMDYLLGLCAKAGIPVSIKLTA